MTKVLVLYWSAYGHTEKLAVAIAEGARSTGAEVAMKRVPEVTTVGAPPAADAKAEQTTEIATPAELSDYDAIIIGSPTRFGGLASPMKHFLDQTGSLWFSGKLVGKVGSVFTSTATGTVRNFVCGLIGCH